MHVTDLPINRAMGMKLSDNSAAHILELPESPLLLNHLETVHASVQFALAEAASGEFLLRKLKGEEKGILVVLRTSEVKFRKPAHGTLRATARFGDGSEELLNHKLSARGRTLLSILVEISNLEGVVTMSGRYDWFLQRSEKPNG